MNILYVSFEVFPFAKTGGLGDVAGSLPAALNGLGADCRIFMPKHRVIREELLTDAKFLYSGFLNLGGYDKYVGLFSLVYKGVTVYFLDNEEFFGDSRGVYAWGEQGADQSVFFCRAVAELLPRLDFKPDIVHCNDWQTALLPAMLKYQYPNISVSTVLTIHNLQYQGIYSIPHVQYLTGLPDECFYPVSGALEFYGAANFLKAGIVCAHRVNTVSNRYAAETLTPEYGEKLEQVLQQKGSAYEGILNGLDYNVFNPARDPLIAQNYSLRKMAGKAACRADLCGFFRIEADSVPVVSIVSRLVNQKGLDLIAGCLDDLLREGLLALVVLGSGDPVYEGFFAELAGRYPQRVGAWLGYSSELANKVYAGSDIFLMPSRFEPCGLSQLIAMKYGTVPVVRETGGLYDTVTSYNEVTGKGDGFTFAPYAAADLEYTLRRAIFFYNNQREVWKKLVYRCMRADFSWKASAGRYMEMYQEMTGNR